MPMLLVYFRHARWMIVVLVLLLTACAPNLFSGARPTSSTAPNATRTLSASSALPSPSATPLRPTPLPALGPDAYRLKPWSEQDALDAILHGEKLDPTADGRLPWDIQEYLLTLEREALLRFPEGKYKNELEWKYAREVAILQYAVLDKDTPVDPFITSLTKALDSGQVTPDMLETWLPNKGFDVVSRHSAPNMFGDNQPVQVLQIKTQDRLLPGDILLAVAKSPQSGSYRLLSVRPDWLTYLPDRQTVEAVSIVSHVGNGRQEIKALSESASTAICRSELSLYEWKGDGSIGHFENIAKAVKPIEGDFPNSECQDPWQFGSPNAQGAQPLTVTLRQKNWAGAECPEYEYKIRYEWDGVAYRWVSGGATLPDKSQPAKCFIGWAHAAAKHGLYDQAIPLVSAALADWPRDLDAVWGPSAKDLFRFELGTWYAFQEDSDKAIATLQDVKDYRANPAFSMTPRMAETYLSVFRDSRDPDRSCVAVYNMLKQEFEQTPDNGGFAATDRTIAAWGFGEPDWLWRTPRLDEVCNHGWRPDIGSSLPSPTAEPPPLTREPTAVPSAEQAQEAAIQLIEKTLFVDGNSQQASSLIERLLANQVIEPNYGSETVKPYLQYLLGLSYELSGDERKAVDAYWRLQKDYPDSLYTSIAQQKMQQVAP